MTRPLKIVHIPILGGWFVVTGPHQVPISGSFDTKPEAEAWLIQHRNRPGPNLQNLPIRTRVGRIIRKAFTS